MSVTVNKGEKEKTYSLAIPRHFRNTRSFKARSQRLNDPLTTLNYKIQGHSALDEICAVCGSNEKVEMHHVKHLRKDQTVVKGFTKLMSELNRKQIPVCKPCHVHIHEGSYNGLSLNELWIKSQRVED